MSPPSILIVGYRPEWKGEFAALAARLRVALGGFATRVDHIGSTAVPGMPAKDVIDVQVTVARLDAASLRPSLEGLGGMWCDITADHAPPGVALEQPELEKRLCRFRDPDRAANVHLRVEGRFNQRYALLCRDYLCAHPGTAAAYAEVKRKLAAHFPDDEDAYYDVKDPAFDLFMDAAWDWAERIGWQPGSAEA